MNLLILSLITINLLFGVVFVYDDIRERSVGLKLFITSIFFVVLEAIIVFETLGLILLIPIAISIAVAIFSYFTGHIGMGDVPLISSYLLFLFAIPQFYTNLILFSSVFIVASMVLPLIIYRKIFKTYFPPLSIILSVMIILLILENIIIGMIALIVYLLFFAVILKNKIDDMYDVSVRDLYPYNVFVGDFLVNSKLTPKEKMEFGVTDGSRITYISNEILEKIKSKGKSVPIYSYSLPFTIPIFIAMLAIAINYICFIL